MDTLIEKAKEHDADAFTQLMQSQMQNMYKAARSFLINDEDVADAISETILVCWEKLGQLRENRYFRTWMTRILINQCKDILRKKENLFLTDETPEVEFCENGFENLEWKEALQCLKEKYRTVVLLYAEISPISLRVLCTFPREAVTTYNSGGTTTSVLETAEPPMLTGVVMKDKTMYPFLYQGPGTMSYTSEDSDEYLMAFPIERILDTDQVESLLFFKSSPEEEKPPTEDNFYIVPLP